jgi:hypothetical protein
MVYAAISDGLRSDCDWTATPVRRLDRWHEDRFHRATGRSGGVDRLEFAAFSVKSMLHDSLA